MIFACLVKYPGLRFGGEYAAATGKSLWSITASAAWYFQPVFCQSAVQHGVYYRGGCPVFFRPAAGRTGLSNRPRDERIPDADAGCRIVNERALQALERVTKTIVIGFTVLTTLCMLLVVDRLDWSWSRWLFPRSMRHCSFIVALVGFMPSPTDASILQSLWTVARAETDGRLATKEESRFDFNCRLPHQLRTGRLFSFSGNGGLVWQWRGNATGNAGFARRLLRFFLNYRRLELFHHCGHSALRRTLNGTHCNRRDDAHGAGYWR